MDSHSTFERIEQTYRYDSLGRLVSVTSAERPELNESYVYDASGNIAEKTIGSKTVRMAYDKANQIVSMRDDDGTRRFEYDSAGRMIRESLNGKPVASFTYGYLDKVTSVTRGGNETHFHYNAGGMLVGHPECSTITSKRGLGLCQCRTCSANKQAGKDAVLLLVLLVHKRAVLCWLSWKSLVTDVKSAPARLQLPPCPASFLNFVLHPGDKSTGRLEPWQWDGLALVARGDDAYINEGHVSGASALMSRSLSEGDERYLLTDYLGTTLAAFDAEGDRNEPTEATAWNVMRTSFGAGSDSPEAMSRFTGKPYDADLGAHVFPYRNYRSDMGRWMSADPIGFPDGPNQHFYAPVPTLGVDPLGLWEEVWESPLPGGTDWQMVPGSMYVYPFGEFRRYNERRMIVNGWEVFGSHSFSPFDSSVQKSITFSQTSSIAIGGGDTVTIGASYSQTSSGTSHVTLHNASQSQWEDINGWLGEALITGVIIQQRTIVEILVDGEWAFYQMLADPHTIAAGYRISGDTGTRYYEN